MDRLSKELSLIAQNHQDTFALLLLVLALVCGFYILAMFWRAKHPPQYFEVTLQDLAVTAGYLDDTPESRRMVMDADDMVRLWRNPIGPFNPNYTPKVKYAAAKEFWTEYVSAATWFDKNKILHRGLIAQMMETFDREHPASSVVQNPKYPADHDNKWDKDSYKILSQVTLFDHSMHACKVLVAHLVKQKETWLIPRAMIAVMAHDLGKLPSVVGHEEYDTAIHPINSVQVLEKIRGFDKLPTNTREEIINAIASHHDVKESSGLASLVRYADRAARKMEYYIYEAENIVPEWIAPVDLPDLRLLYNPHQSTIVMDADDNAPDFLDDLSPYGDLTIPPSVGTRIAQRQSESKQKQKDDDGADIEGGDDSTPPASDSSVVFRVSPEKVRTLAKSLQLPGLDDEAEENETNPGGPGVSASGVTIPAPVDQDVPDEKWEAAVALARQTTDISIKEMQDELRIGKARAEKIYAVLKAGGYFLEPEDLQGAIPRIPPRRPQETSLPSQDAGETPAGPVSEDEPKTLTATELFLDEGPSSTRSPKSTGKTPSDHLDHEEQEEIPEPSYDQVPPVDSERQTSETSLEQQDLFEERTWGTVSAKGYAPETPFEVDPERTGSPPELPTASLPEIGPWFELDAFMRGLKDRLDVDLEKRGRGGSFYQGVTDLSSGVSWFNIQAFKEVAATQMKAAGSLEMAQVMLSDEQDQRPWQGKILLAIIARLRADGILRQEFLPPGCYSVKVNIELRTSSTPETKSMIPLCASNFYKQVSTAMQKRMAHDKVGQVLRVHVVDTE